MTEVLQPPAAPSPGSAGSATVADALAALRAGRPVLVVDGADGEDESDVVLPAALADPAWVAWTVRHTSGLLGAPLEDARADALNLPPMVHRNSDPHGTAYTVSVDAASGISTGISARDRARTARVLANPGSAPEDLSRPGHVLPLRARTGGVLERPGHAEAAVDLCRMAGFPPVGLIADLIADGGSDAGSAMSRSEVAELARGEDLPLLDIAELVRHRRFHGDGTRTRVTRSARAALPTSHGAFDAVGFRDEVTGAEHVALLAPVRTGLLTVGVHVECPVGDVFGSHACRCRQSLECSLAAVAEEGGALVYLRRTGHRFPSAQWCGATGNDEDAGAAAAILADLGMFDVVLCRCSPLDAVQLRHGGIRAVTKCGNG